MFAVGKIIVAVVLFVVAGDVGAETAIAGGVCAWSASFAGLSVIFGGMVLMLLLLLLLLLLMVLLFVAAGSLPTSASPAITPPVFSAAVACGAG